MEILAVILFFVYLWGFGFSLTMFVKESDNLLERNLMRLGVGLGFMPFLGILLSIFGIPIDWRLFLFLAMIVPFIYLIMNFRKIKFNFGFRLTKSNLTILAVLLLFFLTLFMYHKGAFSYPYLEDDDSWEHAATVKYFAVEKTISDSKNIVPYLDPYPPGYGLILAIAHQSSESLLWTMKFFNLLIISLGIMFFYFFAKEFTGNRQKALFATFILAAIPSYQSHFIWAHSLAVTLFFPSMYCLEMIKHDKKWMYTSIFVISGILLTHPTESIKLGMMFFIYFFVKSLYHKKIDYAILIAQIGALVVSIIWWGTRFVGYLQTRFSTVVSHSEKFDAMGIEVGVSGGQNIISKAFSVIKTLFPHSAGTATRAYTFSDFFIVKKQNMINNPIGIGIVLSLLILASIIYLIIRYKRLKEEKNGWLVTSFLWFVLTFLLVNSMTFNLPIGIFAFRVWMLMAIPISLLATEGTWFLVGFFKGFRLIKMIVLILMVLGIIFTSGVQKYAVNTSIWGPGGRWTSTEELQAYLWLNSLPVDTPVFTYSFDSTIIGLDKFSCYWCDSVINFRKDLLYKNASEVYNFLKGENYRYLIIDGMAYKKLGGEFGENETNSILPKRLEEINSFGKFQIVHQTKGAVIFKVL